MLLDTKSDKVYTNMCPGVKKTQLSIVTLYYISLYHGVEHRMYAKPVLLYNKQHYTYIQ